MRSWVDEVARPGYVPGTACIGNNPHARCRRAWRTRDFLGGDISPRPIGERTHNRAVEVVLGLALSGALMLGVVVIWASFRGAFSDKITVSAERSTAGGRARTG